MRSHALSNLWVSAAAVLGAALSFPGCAADDPSQAQTVRDPDSDGTPLDAVVLHWDSLVARSGGALAVRWSAYGTPMSVNPPATPRPKITFTSDCVKR